jgi:hypothetical protein
MPGEPLSDEEIFYVREENATSATDRLYDSSRWLATVDRERRVNDELRDRIEWEHQQHDETRGYRQKAERELVEERATREKAEADAAMRESPTLQTGEFGEGELAERRAIMKWLRKSSLAHEGLHNAEDLADRIGRGEHLR